VSKDDWKKLAELAGAIASIAGVVRVIAWLFAL
jgi:hypothetical protein